MAGSICARCRGFMVLEDFGERWREEGRSERRGLRCVNCGAVEDAVIRANRIHHSPRKQVKLPTGGARV